MVVVMFVGDEKDVVLDFSADGRVSADDISQGGGFQDTYLIVRKSIEIEEPIPIPQSFKLIDENGVNQFPHHGTRPMVFGQRPNPQIDKFDLAIDGFQMLLDLWLTRDVGKREGWGEAQCQADIVVRGNAVISPSLQIEGGQIESSGSGRSKEKISHIVDHIGVNLLRPIGRQSSKYGLNAPFIGQAPGDQKRLPKRQISFRDGLPVLLKSE